jgi:hypothetical protein
MQIYLNNHDESKMRQMAKNEGLSVSAFIRFKCFDKPCQVGESIEIIGNESRFNSKIKLNDYGRKIIKGDEDDIGYLKRQGYWEKNSKGER